jgi:hypothetical protein
LILLLHLLSSGITGVGHCTWLSIIFNNMGEGNKVNPKFYISSNQPFNQ